MLSRMLTGRLLAVVSALFACLTTKAKRRRFTADFKRRILEEADACGAIGAGSVLFSVVRGSPDGREQPALRPSRRLAMPRRRCAAAVS